MPLFYERWAIADTKGETNRCICFILDGGIWNLLALDRGANVFPRTEKEEGGGRRGFNRESEFCLLWLPGTKPVSTPAPQWDESRKQEMWQNGTGRRRREMRARAFWFL